MCNLSWTPHSSLEKDNSLNHTCVSPSTGCLEYTTKNLEHPLVQYLDPGHHCVLAFLVACQSLFFCVLSAFLRGNASC